MRRNAARRGVVLVPRALAMAALLLAGCGEQRSPVAGRYAAMDLPRQEPAPRFGSVLVPAGTRVLAVLETPLSTLSSRPGDTVAARTIEPIYLAGELVLPLGTVVHGQLLVMHPVPHDGGHVRLTLGFDRFVDERGAPLSIEAAPVTLVVPVSSDAGGGLAVGERISVVLVEAARLPLLAGR